MHAAVNAIEVETVNRSLASTITDVQVQEEREYGRSTNEIDREQYYGEKKKERKMYMTIQPMKEGEISARMVIREEGQEEREGEIERGRERERDNKTWALTEEKRTVHT